MEYVWVTGHDWTRLGDQADRLAHFIGNHAFMRMSGGHCAALEVRALPAGERRFFCTIYGQRPEICRALARGSPECLGELETKAARVNEGFRTPPVS
jgi:Fe-S-cluster containining protein